MFRKTTVAVTLVLVLSLLVVGVASAIEIVVDGVREAAWDGAGLITDLNEGGITDGYDIDTFQWTNSGLSGPNGGSGNMFFLISTYADTIVTGFLPPTIIICLNTDGLATGGTYANCNNMSGIDRSIAINLTTNTFTVFNGGPGGPVLGSGSSATQTRFTEVAIPLSLFGFGAGNCPAAMPTSVYFDNGITDPDDNVPDAGTFNINCGTPTAVTLSSLQAQPTTSPVLPVALVGVSAVALIGVVFLIRRKKTA
jgi:hypothetical protein